MKKTKIILVVALGICMLSFMPTVLGKANKGPISAFTDTNPDVVGWGDTETNLAVFPHGFVWDQETIVDCDHHGFVLVRELKDGRILFQVNLHVKGAYMYVVWMDTYGLVFEGEMDYFFSLILIVEGDISDPVPNLFNVFLGIEPGETPFMHITGGGTGTFTDYGEELGLGVSGESAKLKVNQVGITKPEGHPFYPQMWPVELVFFH